MIKLCVCVLHWCTFFGASGPTISQCHDPTTILFFILEAPPCQRTAPTSPQPNCWEASDHQPSPHKHSPPPTTTLHCIRQRRFHHLLGRSCRDPPRQGIWSWDLQVRILLRGSCWEAHKQKQYSAVRPRILPLRTSHRRPRHHHQWPRRRKMRISEVNQFVQNAALSVKTVTISDHLLQMTLLLTRSSSPMTSTAQNVNLWGIRWTSLFKTQH